MKTILRALAIMMSLGVFIVASKAHDTSSQTFKPASPSHQMTQTLMAFGRYFNIEVDGRVLLGVNSKTLAVNATWTDLLDAIRTAELPFEAKRISLSKLQERQGVALLQLNSPEQVVVAQAFGTTHTLLWDSGRDHLTENTELQKRYSGEALLWRESPKASWQIEEPVRFLKAESIGGASELVATVTLRNKGKKPLVVEVASTSCGCTGASVAPATIPPGGSSIVTAKMHATDNRLVTVKLRADDPARPHAVLALQSQVPQGINPPATVMLNTHKGEVATASIVVQLPSDSTVSKATTRQSWLRASVVPASVAGAVPQLSGYRVEVTLAADAPAGRLQDEITLQLQNAPVRSLIVPVDGYVSNDIKVQPSLISLDAVPRGSTLRKTVIVRGPAEMPFSIRSITGSSERVSGKADPTVVATSHAVELQIEIASKIGDWLQERATLSLSDGRVLDVDILGTITPPQETKAGEVSLRVGQIAPDFTVTDANSVTRRLTEQKGRKNVLLTFFPRCFTGGCAGQLASLQKELPNYIRDETEIWAVSVDPAQEQTAFAKELGVEFPLIPDTERALCLLYGAAKDKTDLAKRQSVLIDKTGVVRWIDTDINVHTHGADILAKMRELGMVQ